MTKTRPRIPVGLIITIILLLILGTIAGPIIQSLATPEQLATSILLGAIPFILIFVAIVLSFIGLIVIVSSILTGNVPPRLYSVIESTLIAGIVLGVVGMFQPWFFLGYKYGFVLLLVSVLLFIVWSHISPKGETPQKEELPASISETTTNQIEINTGA